VKFPLRILNQETYYDMLLYGGVSLACLAAAFHIYRRFGRRGWRLMAVVLLGVVLAGWQVFDLAILRYEGASVYGFGPVMSSSFGENDGLAWYGLRFENSGVWCHGLYERYWGNRYIAITVEINREATWFACGG
jgi:hypothetical protein